MGAKLVENSQESAKKNISTNMKRVVPYLSEYKFKITIIILGSLLFALIRLIDPYIYRIVMDDVLVKAYTGNLSLGPAIRTVAIACSVIFFLRIVTSSVFGFYSYLSLEVGNRIEMKMFRDALAHLQSLDMSFHHNQNSGEVLAKVERGIGGLQRVMHDNLSKFFLPGTINVTCLLVWIFYQNWKMAVAATFFIPFHIYFSLGKAKPIYEEQSKINKAEEKIYHRAYEGIYNVEAVVSFNASRHELSLFDKERIPAFYSQLRIAKWWRLLGFSASFFEVLGRTAIIIVGTYLTIQKKATPGEILMFLAYITMLYQPLLDMITTYLSMQQDLSKVHRFFDLLDTKPKVTEISNPIDMSPLRHSIELKNVSFGYEDSTGVIKDMNLVIPAGKKIAVVGKTGAGKSTLASLIQRFYDPEAGIITADGNDLRNIGLESLRRQITTVPQHALLFSRTIKENIAYGCDEPDDNKIIEAARIANAHEFIDSKPEKYDTVIGEKGVKLSGGEQQRISIARAVFSNASLIIMDEATSHLDTDSEAVVQEALWKLMEGKTAIIIAHRLSTILRADSIVVMDKGRIIDRGTSQELLERCLLYRRLYNRQFELEDDDLGNENKVVNIKRPSN